MDQLKTNKTWNPLARDRAPFLLYDDLPRTGNPILPFPSLSAVWISSESLTCLAVWQSLLSFSGSRKNSKRLLGGSNLFGSAGWTPTAPGSRSFLWTCVLWLGLIYRSSRRLKEMRNLNQTPRLLINRTRHKFNKSKRDAKWDSRKNQRTPYFKPVIWPIGYLPSQWSAFFDTYHEIS